jgi:hypothetical protein
VYSANITVEEIETGFQSDFPGWVGVFLVFWMLVAIIGGTWFAWRVHSQGWPPQMIAIKDRILGRHKNPGFERLDDGMELEDNSVGIVEDRFEDRDYHEEKERREKLFIEEELALAKKRYQERPLIELP